MGWGGGTRDWEGARGARAAARGIVCSVPYGVSGGVWGCAGAIFRAANTAVHCAAAPPSPTCCPRPPRPMTHGSRVPHMALQGFTAGFAETELTFVLEQPHPQAAAAPAAAASPRGAATSDGPEAGRGQQQDGQAGSGGAGAASAANAEGSAPQQSSSDAATSSAGAGTSADAAAAPAPAGAGASAPCKLGVASVVMVGWVGGWATPKWRGGPCPTPYPAPLTARPLVPRLGWVGFGVWDLGDLGRAACAQQGGAARVVRGSKEGRGGPGPSTRAQHSTGSGK